MQTLFYCLLNISAKFQQNWSLQFLAIPFQSWYIFWDTVYHLLLSNLTTEHMVSSKYTSTMTPIVTNHYTRCTTNKRRHRQSLQFRKDFTYCLWTWTRSYFLNSGRDIFRRSALWTGPPLSCCQGADSEWLRVWVAGLGYTWQNYQLQDIFVNKK